MLHAGDWVTGRKAQKAVQTWLAGKLAVHRWALYRAGGTEGWLLAHGPIWAVVGGDLALILFPILSENMSKSNSQPCSEECNTRNWVLGP